MSSYLRRGETGRRLCDLGFPKHLNRRASYRPRRRKNSRVIERRSVPVQISLAQSEQEFHRKIAVECFNKTWDYLEKRDRTPNDNRSMLNVAHSSRYHWSFVGKAPNFAIGDWQISRVYSALNQPELAKHFAKTAIQTCQKNNLSGLLASAYEGMARAYAVAKEYRSAREFIDRARHQLRSQVTQEEDLKTYSDQIDETEQTIPK